MTAIINNQAWDCNAEDDRIIEESEILHQRLFDLDEDSQTLKEYETAYRRSLELEEDNQILEEYETAHRRSLEDNQSSHELIESNRLLEKYEIANKYNQIIEDCETIHRNTLELAESNRLIEAYETTRRYNQFVEECETAYRISLGHVELPEDYETIIRNNQFIKDCETIYIRSLELAENNINIEEYETNRKYNQFVEECEIAYSRSLELAETNRLLEEYEINRRHSHEDTQILEDDYRRSLELAESERLLEEYETIHQQSREIKLLRDNALVLFSEKKSELTKQIEALEVKMSENQKHIDALENRQDADDDTYSDIIKQVEDSEMISDNVSYFVNHFNEIYNTEYNFDEIKNIQDIVGKYNINVQDSIKYSNNCHNCGINTPVGYELCGNLCNKTFDFSTTYIKDFVCFWGDDCKMCRGYEKYNEVCVTCSNKKTDSDCGYIVNYNKSYCENCETKDEIKENNCFWGENCENCKEYTGNEEDRFCCSCDICEKLLTDHEGYCDEDINKTYCNKCAENHFSENVNEEIINEEIINDKNINDENESDDYAKFYTRYIQKQIELMLDEDV